MQVEQLIQKLTEIEAKLDILLSQKEKNDMPVMSVKDACKALGISRSTFDRMQKVEKVKKGGKWYVSRAWVENYHTINL